MEGLDGAVVSAETGLGKAGKLMWLLAEFSSVQLIGLGTAVSCWLWVRDQSQFLIVVGWRFASVPCYVGLPNMTICFIKASRGKNLEH